MAPRSGVRRRSLQHRRGASAAGAAGVTPGEVNIALDPGGSQVVQKDVETSRLPPTSDFVFPADNTGSMGPAINDVKANAQAIIDSIEGAGATDARYAVANYEDFRATGGGCNYGFQEDTDLTTAAAAKTAINTWTAGDGCDLPEANLFALHRVAAHDTTWRADSTRFVIWFGDAPGHDPVCSAISGDPHTVTEASAIADLQAAGARVIAASANSGPGLNADPRPIGTGYGPCGPEQGTAGQATRIAAATGGVSLPTVAPGQISAAIIGAIDALPPIPVTVTPTPTCDAGLTATNAPVARTVPSGSTAEFDETIAVGAAAVPGSTLNCTVDYRINGASAGPEYVQRIAVRVGVGYPTALELTPATATNPVDTEHCVTATVRDAFGDPVAGTDVDFGVAGTNDDTGTVATDADGQAEFCYDVGPFAGNDTITAIAQDGTRPSDTATKAIVLPDSTPGCKVTYGGRILATNGDRATFGGNAQVPTFGPKGQATYQDHGPAMPLEVRSTSVDAVICRADGTATVFGTATVDGGAPTAYRIDVRDAGEPSGGDRYRIRLASGYDSGSRPLEGGNVRVHE